VGWDHDCHRTANNGRRHISQINRVNEAPREWDRRGVFYVTVASRPAARAAWCRIRVYASAKLYGGLDDCRRGGARRWARWGFFIFRFFCWRRDHHSREKQKPLSISLQPRKKFHIACPKTLSANRDSLEPTDAGHVDMYSVPPPPPLSPRRGRRDPFSSGRFPFLAPSFRLEAPKVACIENMHENAHSSAFVVSTGSD
jgi:hypothetical protein